MPRTTNIFLIFFLLFSIGSFAQEVFIIEGDTLNLTQEVKGDISLYSSHQKDSSMRYFIQKEARMTELKNENIGGVPRFRSQLKDFTSNARISTDEVEFSLPDLRDFVLAYNARSQEGSLEAQGQEGLEMRLGFFTGLSNKVYTANPDNTLVPIIGFGFEIFDPEFAPRHAALLHLRHSFQREEFSFSETELSVNYRFKLLNLPNVSLHIDAELATLSYSQEEIVITDQTGQVREIRDENGFSLKAPFSFGIGSDIRITDHSSITLGYNDVVSLFLDNNGNFPIDITIGYKYDL